MAIKRTEFGSFIYFDLEDCSAVKMWSQSLLTKIKTTENCQLREMQILPVLSGNPK